MRPFGELSIMIGKSAAWTSESSQSKLLRIHLNICLVSGNWCWTWSEQNLRMVCDARFWFKNDCSENLMFPIHFQFTKKFIVSLISWYQWSVPMKWAFMASYSPLPLPSRLDGAIIAAYWIPRVDSTMGRYNIVLSSEYILWVYGMRYTIYNFTDPCSVEWGCLMSRVGTTVAISTFSRMIHVSCKFS